MGPRFGPRPFEPHVFGPSILHLVVMLLLIAALVALIVWLVLSARRQPHTQIQPLPGAPRVDEALRETRMRYARGELTREQFLQIAADLGEPTPAEPAG
jgi:uncharacterized membrane protein